MRTKLFRLSAQRGFPRIARAACTIVSYSSAGTRPPRGRRCAIIPGSLRDPARGRDDRGRRELCRAAPDRVQGRGAGDRSDRPARVRRGGRDAALAACAGPHRGGAGREHQGRHGGARGRQGQSRGRALRCRAAGPHAHRDDHAARGGRDDRAQGRQGAEDRRPAERHDRRHARGAARRQPAGAGARLLRHRARQGANTSRCRATRSPTRSGRRRSTR